VAQPAAATITPTPVKTTAQDEILPSAGKDIGGSEDAYLAWSQNSSGAPSHYDSWYQINGGTATKANLDGTAGWGGGIDGPTLVSQEVTKNGNGNSGLAFFDLSTQTRLDPPSGINDENWQWQPTVSGDYVLYGENSRPHNFWRTVLHNTNTDVETVLAHSTYKAQTSYPGQVNGDYATVSLVTPKTIQSRIRTISSRQNTFVPNLALRPTYYPAITPDGMVYFVRSGDACGDNVRIYRWMLGSADKPVLLTSFPAGSDAGTRLFAFNDGSSTSVYFDQYNCHSHLDDIYVLEGADTGSPSVRLIGNAGRASGGLKAGRTIPGSTRSES
jgi:hypothetical protein